MRRIFSIIESTETGGAEHVFFDINTKIDKNQFIPHVILPDNGWLYKQFEKIGIKPHIIPKHTKGFDFKALLKIIQYIKKHRIDIIHSHLFGTNFYASVAGKICNVPIISTFHGTVDVDKADKKKKIKFYFINKYSGAVVYVSNYLKEYFQRNKLSKKSNAKIIYNGIEIGNSPISRKKSVSIKNCGLSLGDTVICAVGDIRPSKDYETMLFSIKEIKKKIPNIKLLIAGTKTQEFKELNKFKNKLGLNDNVKFLGYIEDIRDVFNVSDLYLSTSTTEGFSLTIVEAMSAGVPVVSTKSGGPEEIIENGRNGLLVKKKSPEEIANAIYRIINNSELRDKMVRNGWKTVKESFNVNLMINNYQKLYLELLGGDR